MSDGLGERPPFVVARVGGGDLLYEGGEEDGGGWGETTLEEENYDAELLKA